MDSQGLIVRLLLFVFTANMLLGVYFILDSPENHVRGTRSAVQSGPIPSESTSYQASRAWEEYLRLLDADKPHQGILTDSDYCQKVAQFRLKSPMGPSDATGLPQSEDRVIFSDYKPGNLVKEAAKTVGKLTMQSHFMERAESEYKHLTPLDPSILLFHHKTPHWHLRHRISSEFLCPGQRYNHIPGHEHMVFKDQMAKLAKRYGAMYEDRRDCFDPWQFMPETLNLAKEEECREFFDRVKAENRTGEIRWIKKKARNSHNAAGVEVVTRDVQIALEEKYQSGEKCGHVRDHYIIQKYIPDPLLLDNKKFDFRVYMLIASLDPLLVLYHDGFLRVSLVDFDTKSNDTMAHVTNTQLAKDMLDRENATEEEYAEAMERQMWTFAEFEEFMKGKGLVGEQWIDTYVRPQMKRNMAHLVRMATDRLLRHPGVYELFGVDFLFDSSLNLWFLEVNRSPAMQATTLAKGNLQSRLTSDVLEIEFSLIRGDIDAVVERSGFTWVIDERKKGASSFHGLISRECL